MVTYTNHDGIGKKSLKRDGHRDDGAAWADFTEFSVFVGG
jgi:hypothetical protein